LITPCGPLIIARAGALQMHHSQYTISTDRSRFDVEMIYGFLTHSYWAEGVPRDVVQRSIDNAMCFGVFDGDRQIGFARVITDRATYAYIGDVFILESHRGRGLSKRLMKAIMEHADLQGLRRWSLVTTDAHGLYQQFGFTPLANPQRYMELANPDVYKKQRR
jgi:GNAT superfamily N-acetyltransferase